MRDNKNFCYREIPGGKHDLPLYEIIAVVWNDCPMKGEIRVANGKLKKLKTVAGGSVNGAEFDLPKGGRLEVELAEFTLKQGAFPTIINVAAKTGFCSSSFAASGRKTGAGGGRGKILSGTGGGFD